MIYLMLLPSVVISCLALYNYRVIVDLAGHFLPPVQSSPRSRWAHTSFRISLSRIFSTAPTERTVGYSNLHSKTPYLYRYVKSLEYLLCACTGH